MTVTITINTDNEAFREVDGAWGNEVGRILRNLADLLRDCADFAAEDVNLFDRNGNKFGRFEVVEEPAPALAAHGRRS